MRAATGGVAFEGLRAPAPLRPALHALLGELTDRVLSASGRFSFATAILLTPSDVERGLCHEALQAFAALERRMAPEGVPEHALARRALAPWLPPLREHG